MVAPEPKRLKPPSVMFLDIESSGLYREKLSIDDSSQPWAVSIAAALCTADGEFLNFCRLMVKPEGRSIQAKAGEVHGITTREASQFGIPEARALGLLSDFLKTMPMDSWIRCVSYGNFDPKVLSSLFARFAISQGKSSSAYDRLWMARPYVEFINLMDPYCTMLCKIPSENFEGQWKWPSLDEASEIILGRPPREGKHSAWEDMLILRDLYLRFRELGHFQEGEAV